MILQLVALGPELDWLKDDGEEDLVGSMLHRRVVVSNVNSLMDDLLDARIAQLAERDAEIAARIAQLAEREARIAALGAELRRLRGE